MIKDILLKCIIIFIAFFTISAGSVNAGNNLGYKTNDFAIMQSRKVKKAQKKQDQKEKDEKKAIKESSKTTQKRAYEIQSPAVKQRMKQNKKDVKTREKSIKKYNDLNTKIGSRKYR